MEKQVKIWSATCKLWRSISTAIIKKHGRESVESALMYSASESLLTVMTFIRWFSDNESESSDARRLDEVRFLYAIKVVELASFILDFGGYTNEGVTTFSVSLVRSSAFLRRKIQEIISESQYVQFLGQEKDRILRSGSSSPV